MEDDLSPDYVHAVTQRKYRFNRWSMNCMCHTDFWLERFPQLLDSSVTLEALPVAAVVSDGLKDHAAYMCHETVYL